MATGWGGRAIGAGVLVLLLLVLLLSSLSSATELRITTPPRNATVMNGKRLELHCRAQGGDLPIRILWFHNGKEMYKHGHNYRISNHGILRFSQVAVRDRGTYHCKAMNDVEAVTSDPIQLIVHAEAEMISYPQKDITETFGTISTLACEAAGIPMPSIQWRIRGVSITKENYSQFGVVAIDEKRNTPATLRSVLYINVTESNEFECEAVNRHVEGDTTKSKTVFLTVRPPTMHSWQGECKPYDGSICRMQLGSKMVYHNLTTLPRVGSSAGRDDLHNGSSKNDADDKLTVSVHEVIMRNLLTEMNETGLFTTSNGTPDNYCKKPAVDLMCHFAFPDCQKVEGGRIVSLPVCREHCLAVKDLYCYRQWILIEEDKNRNISYKSRGHFRLPDCSALPSMWSSECSKAQLFSPPTSREVRDDCYVDRGRWYNGTVNVTAKGIPCQPWEDNQPHQHDRPPQIFTELMGAENYCRNPGGEEERPWCYTMDKLTRWEFCDIPHCDDKNSITTTDMDKEVDVLPIPMVAIIIITVFCALGVIIIGLFIGLCINLFRRAGTGNLGYKPAAKDDVDAAIQQLPANAAYHQLRTPGKLNPKLESYEFPRNDIVFLRDIGQGAFGRVFKAKVHGSGGKNNYLKSGESELIAVKMLKEDASEDLQADFEREASLMVEFKHPNIVRLLGVCAVGKPMCLLFEYMSKGDLNEFLRLCGPEHFTLRSHYSSRVHSADAEDGLCFGGGGELCHMVEKGEDEEGEMTPARLTVAEQLYIAQQVSAGMAYLAQRGYVHRDLATRNCLVSTNLVVKISDFGLARSVHSVDYYRGSEHDAIPIRWMPLEAILYNKFSTKSDVWSFGVVLWEIFSFALQPYYGLTHDEVVRFIKEGKILAQPDRTPQQVYELMKQCWHRRPTSRPSFNSLHKTLENMCETYQRNEIKLKEKV